MEAKRGFELLHPEPRQKFNFHAIAGPRTGLLLELRLQAIGVLTTIFPAPDLIPAEHLWNGRFPGIRRQYRPDLPLYLILPRVYRLQITCVIPNRPPMAVSSHG